MKGENCRCMKVKPSSTQALSVGMQFKITALQASIQNLHIKMFVCILSLCTFFPAVSVGRQYEYSPNSQLSKRQMQQTPNITQSPSVTPWLPLTLVIGDSGHKQKTKPPPSLITQTQLTTLHPPPRKTDKQPC